MAFNGFPATYQPMYYQPQQQQAQNNLIWVQGEAAARGYLMAPNTTIALWDSEANVIYLKSTDAAGMPSMKVLDYSIRDKSPTNAPVAAQAQANVNTSEYATKAEIAAITAQIKAIKAQVDGLAKEGEE